MDVVGHQSPGKADCRGLLQKIPHTVEETMVILLILYMALRSIPRIAIWRSAPGASIRAFLGMVHHDTYLPHMSTFQQRPPGQSKLQKRPGNSRLVERWVMPYPHEHALSVDFVLE